jgi:hypothetical protein
VQWVSAFATSGDRYRLTHEAPNNIYSATSDTEAVNGKVVGGKDGYFEVDMPLYSSRPFLHAAVLNGPKQDAQIIHWDRDRIVVSLPTDLPKNSAEIWFRRGDGFLKANKEGNQLVWDGKKTPARKAEEFFAADQMKGFNQYEWQGEFQTNGAFRPLLARFCGDAKQMQYSFSDRPLDKDQLQLCVYAPVPESFTMRGKDFGRGSGWVLFVHDLFKGEPAVEAADPGTN